MGVRTLKRVRVGYQHSVDAMDVGKRRDAHLVQHGIPIILIVGICSRKVLKKSVLAPVYQITETAEDIGKEKDLSKRID